MKNTICILTMAAVAATGFGKDSEVDPSGYLYGEVTMKSGNAYRGVLRWGTEEMFWDDLLNSTKDELPYAKHVPEEKMTRKREMKVFGYKVSAYRERYNSSRQFMARFGDVDRLETAGSEGAEIYMKSGARIYVRGYSNDIGAKITVWDESVGKIELEWRRIEAVQFMPTPRDVAFNELRLRGRVETQVGVFEGFVQWDAQEAIGSDKLDGETGDGDISVEMGRLRSIEKRNSASSLVTLKDGRELVMRGSNDVNDDIRGIYVEDERIGRVKIDWDNFIKVVFEESDSTGRSYEDYQAFGDINGAVVDRGGKSYRGRLVYDADEAELWEMLNGNVDDVEYIIPFSNVASVATLRDYGARVTLRSGLTLSLEDAADVNRQNLGLLVFQGGGDPVYISWDDVNKIDF